MGKETGKKDIDDRNWKMAVEAVEYHKKRKERGNTDFLEVKKLLIDKGIDPEILGEDEYDTKVEYLEPILCDASVKLSLVRGFLSNTPPEEVSQTQIMGIRDMIEEIDKLVDVAFELSI